VINLHQTIEANGMKIKCYYAGHVLGACMFLIEYKNLKVVYTGDFNSNADRHLGAAWIEKVRPDALITETTYADTLRDSKRTRERDFLKQVHEAIENGGKVLIPVFALGRAQVRVRKKLSLKIIPGIVYIIGDILGKNQVKSSHLFCSRIDRKSQFLLQIICQLD